MTAAQSGNRAAPRNHITACLRCGKVGDHPHIGYASSRACTEQGFLCSPCYKALMDERHSGGWYVWPRDMRDA